jgi:FMN-dependent oxidoreductase (nitrilotriacetate monooxygenase family)
MVNSNRQLVLNAFLVPAGHHIAAWRHSDAEAAGGVDFEHYRQLAQIAEDALFDSIFIADFSASYDPKDAPVIARTGTSASLEPITLLSALAAVTKRIGLIATVSTTFNEPYNLARKFASLDLLSRGRAGWNLVTTGNEPEAFNFGDLPLPPHAERYARAREFAEVTIGLWESWDDDAFLRDKDSGIFFDPTKVHVLNHHGPRFSVRGPLNVARSPQGRPVIVQAGSSEDGRAFAAQTAEVIFVATPTLAEAQEFYADMKSRAVAEGRSADDVKILPGVFPVIGRTQAEAEAKFQALQDLIHPEIGLGLLSVLLGTDLRGVDVEGKLPELPEAIGHKGRQKLLIDLARRDGLSVRELYLRVAGARGHWTILGTPATIADQLQHWFENGAADGFNIMPPILPGGLIDFTTLVVPELQKRGLFRTAYEGETLREHLGLKKPNRSSLKQKQLDLEKYSNFRH